METINKDRFSLYIWDAKKNTYLIAFTSSNLKDIREITLNPYFKNNMNSVNIRKETLINGTWLCISHYTAEGKK